MPMPSGGTPPKGIVAAVAALLFISIFYTVQIMSTRMIRMVDFLSILATGVLAGILLSFLFRMLRSRYEQED